MPLSDSIKYAPEISGTKPWKNLSLQDALLIIAIYAAQLDTAVKDEASAKRIADLVKQDPLFSNESADIVARIYKLSKSARVRDLPKAVDHATKSLTLKLRRTAFRWAAALAVDNGILPEKNQDVIEQLKIKLLIDANTADKIINKAISQSKP
jgi:hypothetical protein